MGDGDDEQVVDDPERVKVRRWRKEAAERAGLTRVEAELFADGDTSMSVLRGCVVAGWTPEQIRAVVL